eukprot:6203046-Pleurochrysis_carterae.AAC.7
MYQSCAAQTRSPQFCHHCPCTSQQPASSLTSGTLAPPPPHPSSHAPVHATPPLNKHPRQRCILLWAMNRELSMTKTITVSASPPEAAGIGSEPFPWHSDGSAQHLDALEARAVP